MNQCTYRK